MPRQTGALPSSNSEPVVHRFIIKPTGDPYNLTGWDILECKNFTDRFMIFRGDISPWQGRDRTIRMLRRAYRGCKIRVER